MNRDLYPGYRVTSYDAELRAHNRARLASRLFFAALMVSNIFFAVQMIRARMQLATAKAQLAFILGVP